VAVAEGDLGEQQALVVEIDADVLEADEQGVRRQRLDRLHRRLDQRNVVDHVQTDADVFAARRAHPRDELIRTPALMVLDRQRHLVAAQDRLGALHGRLAHGVELVELRRGLELLVAAARERIMDADDAAVHLRQRLDVASYSGQIVVGAGRPHSDGHAHVVAVELFVHRPQASRSKAPRR
jgi:hypothetical protein